MAASQIAHDITRRAPAAATTTGITTGNAQVDTLLGLLADGFETQIQTRAFLASLATSLGITIGIIVLFCFIRPLNNVVYAPRAKYADSKHAPPPVGRTLLGWVGPLIHTKEPELVEKLGLDAAVFLRFVRMCRNMSLALAVVGCGILIPTNLIAGRKTASSFKNVEFLTKLTPQYMIGSTAYWAYVAVAYIFNIIICYFLWSNYRVVVRLRRSYFESTEYQQSLAARTLLVTEIPKDFRSDEGLQQITEDTYRTNDVPRAAIARNMKELPELVAEYEHAVEDLEAVLAKYLKNPNKLPAQRPTCKVAKKDAAYQRGKKVDAIEYLSNRIQQLERQVKETRQTVDKRNAENYGFASYPQIADAHATAYAGRKRGAKKTFMRLAPKPHDLIWKNLPLTTRDRNWANFVNNLWVSLLTLAWIAPNVLSAVFLSNLSHLGQVWPAFNTSLREYPTWWGVVQGVASPAIQSLFYFYLPAIFRRLSVKAGDFTKTSRERHVVHKLFAFFLINNLIIYSLFSAIWGYVATVVLNTQKGEAVLTALTSAEGFQTIMLSLVSMSTFWLTWLLQRNLSAAIDLAQLFNLGWGSFSRRFLSPTPRQLIKLSAPQPFDYADYYNYFLFYMAVTLFYAPLQPLVLAVTALYFWLDSYMKKYLLMYVFITKTESGGKFWRVLYNRVLFNAFLGNVIIALVVIAQGSTWSMAIALAPLPFLLLAFKWYCARTFDTRYNYYATKSNIEAEGAASKEAKRGTEKVGVRFGHPVLYRALITPMVHAKAQHLLKTIYSGRTSLDGDDPHNVSGYSDMYMNPMSQSKPGKSASSTAPFEIVAENDLNFEHFKGRADFAHDAGGDGELYGRSRDMMRRGSEQSGMTDMLFGGADSRNTPRADSRAGSRSDSISSERTKVHDGATYPSGYHQPSNRDHSVDSYSGNARSASGVRGEPDESGILHGAARMGRSPPPSSAPFRRDESLGPLMPRHDGWAPTSQGYTPNAGTPVEENTSYDYFRGRQG